MMPRHSGKAPLLVLWRNNGDPEAIKAGLIVEI